MLFGGRSSEHSISCATASGVLGAIDRERYDVIPVGITRDGAFTLQPDDPARFALSSDLPEVIDNGTRVRLPDSAASSEWTVTDAAGATTSLGTVDVAFPILHGPFGEDGTVQGMLELFGIPYVGAGVLASAAGMDKHFTKSLLQHAGIPVADWVTITAGERESRRPGLVEELEPLGWPLFVKPARAGSSVGVTRVAAPEGLDAALDAAFAEDSRVLVERALVGREVECAVLAGRNGGAPRVSVAGEIVVTGRDFYDFEAKYLDAPGIELVCPAVLSDAELAEMRRVAAAAFDAIGGAGLARVDFFLTDDGFVVNEVNTMPGFTPISMFPKCWIASGVSYPELIDELITLGLETAR
ncbi:D-alanine--D-alanine ligase family protein [Ruicaihuangia caeni]|uniref:D-alanine--D-alanine ligase n=1 Tax=Ruicaihuangia caeni TaxID=3042517 RepID=A0AAW6T5L4_9MICO|nr:D-alanine--D-alanine ligase family protein [Klugiella sp. YN-L-19]MDI2097663.1 D-alanine--D-alanine ligase family protein [Klugiella sp. YN-L-19]